MDRQLARLNATLLQICGEQCKEEDFYLTEKPPAETEEENTEKMLAWMDQANGRNKA